MKVLAVIVLLCAAIVPARADGITTVTFTEILLSSVPPATQMTNQYAAFGLTFQNAYYAVDPRLLQDGHGIAEGTGNLFTETSEISTILFTHPVSDLSMTWFSIESQFF